MIKETYQPENVTLRYQYRPKDGTWSTQQTVNQTVGYYKGTYGVNTPNFHARKRRGELLPFTPFKQIESKAEAIAENFHYQRISNGDEYRWFGQVGAGNLISSIYSPDPSESHYDAGVLLQNAASRAAPAWDALTFLSEAHKLAGMFRGTASSIISYLRGKPQNTPWSDWLQFRYGWRPFLYDIADIQEALQIVLKKKKRSTSSARSGTGQSWETSSTSFTDYSSYKVWVTTRTTYKLSARGTVVFQGNVRAFQFNPVKTWWEITRFSFMVDWFINIGRAIDALFFVVGTPSYTAGSGHLLEAITVQEVNREMKSGWQALSQIDFTRGPTTTYYTGRAPARVPLLPRFQPNLSPAKVVDLVAILLQTMSR